MELKKELTLIDLFCIATGAMIGSGLFILPGIAHAQAGPAVVVSYFLAGLLALTGMLSQSELVSAMPKSGGTYFYITRSLGPAAGTINGLITWISLSLKTSFALVGMAAFSKMLYNIDIRILSLLLCILFVIINIIGIKEAGKLQIALVFSLLGILLFYILFGFKAITIQHFEPFAPYGITSIISTTGMVFISYGGLLKVASIAEEVKKPSKTIPMAMILSLFVVSICYSLVVFITSGVLGSSQLDHSLTPITDSASVFLPRYGTIILNIAAILAFVSTANAGIMAASRYPLALARDKLLPRCFGNIHKKLKTPYYAILSTGLIISISLFLDLTMLVKTASAVLISTFLFSCLSVIIMRESGLQNYAPQFKAPLYPWIQIFGICSYLYLIITMGPQILFTFFGLVLGGLFIYWFYGRIRTTREYALLHLLTRITSKELTNRSRSLETELKEIIFERDDIIQDQFDTIIEQCAILDINHKMSMQEFFTLAAETIAPRLNKSTQEIERLLLKREEESSTVIAPETAIPHIVIPGEHLFDILLVRCQKGIRFPENPTPIQAVFILAGTIDERNFHLRALSAIAQILQNKNFLKKWLAAKNIEGLRDVILLGERMRNI